jgi:sulfite oxidase
MRRRPSAGAAGGVVAAAVGLGVGELLTGALSTHHSPVVAVADRIIRLGPASWERFLIELLGTNDKPALVTLVVAATFALGALAGTLTRLAARLVIGGVTAVGGLALLAEPQASTSHIVPALLGGIAALATLELLANAAGEHVARPLPPAGADRRRFLLAGSTAAVVAAAAAATGRSLQGGDGAATSRASVRLPAPANPTTAPAAGNELAVAGITPFVTRNDDFYRIDTAIVIPNIDAKDWTLTIDGMVDHVRHYTYDDLVKRPLVERQVTLACVSNAVGGSLIGNATWLGVPLAELLDEAGVQSSADQIVGRSVDDFTAGFPVSAVRDGRTALVAVGMNGQPLPLRHGFPARLVVAGLYGYVSATKWLDRIELTRFDAYTPYWVERGWADHGPIKVSSRIDTPRKKVTAGVVPVAGVAWAQHRGIAKVEVRVDEGRWHEATLAPAGDADTWRQWRWDWSATPGSHRLQVRATTADGERQTGTEHEPFPDGATGWHTVGVKVTR